MRKLAIMECLRDGFPRKKYCFFVFCPNEGGRAISRVVKYFSPFLYKCSIAPIIMEKLFGEFRLVKDTATEVYVLRE